MAEKSVDSFKGYGSRCPFCHTDVPDRASVCAACGARKGTTGEKAPGVMFIALAILFGIGAGICGVWATAVDFFIPYLLSGGPGPVPIASWIAGIVTGVVLLPVGLVMFRYSWKIIMYPFTQPRWFR
jgi:hypothetical protein